MSSMSPPILPAHIEDTVRAISELHAQHHRQATPVQRIVDRSVRTVGRPRFVALLSVFILLWVTINWTLTAKGYPADAPPFQVLQDVGEALGLYITVLILITQRRDDELTQHREQLTLELANQKPDEMKPASVDHDPKDVPPSLDEGDPKSTDDGSGTSETD